eukprot:TRINITY_DN1913_c0_g1_i1.p2 TRINITY_DN1913_c0_g1~~TRINITY_DN1913_c0_g1_i1.p2  ORF type:complete len:62 (+),score=5.42 TRINITY_DN1913_c0_g1_i1:221-406(+)
MPVCECIRSLGVHKLSSMNETALWDQNLHNSTNLHVHQDELDTSDPSNTEHQLRLHHPTKY